MASPEKFTDYEVSSGNIFADLDLPNAEELNTKATLAARIVVLIQKRGLTQAKAAQLMGIDQPKVSDLNRGRLEKFSIERLCELLTRLGCDIKITIHQRLTGNGRITVTPR
jgi:predicted XRE-type DNA-binding protein